jgi:hypothetical protein
MPSPYGKTAAVATRFEKAKSHSQNLTFVYRSAKDPFVRPALSLQQGVNLLFQAWQVVLVSAPKNISVDVKTVVDHSVAAWPAFRSTVAKDGQ